MPYYRHPADWSPERVLEHLDARETALNSENALRYRPSISDCCAQCTADTTRERAEWDAAHPEALADIPAALEAFDTAALAHTGKAANEKVTFLPNHTERISWRRREQDRFRHGAYLPVPWDDLEPVDDYSYSIRFPHFAVKSPGLIAYTKTEEHGVLDRQTAVRPGRYLKDYFPDMSDADVRDWVSKCQSTSFELQFARTADDIERVYLGGPSSCMAHPESAFSSCVHPVRVYGDSDLAVAYYGNIDKASARAVVWPDRKIYSRIYGGDTLRLLLEQAGYEQGSLSGAKVQALYDDDRSCYVMPYVDYINYACETRLDGKTWLVLGSGRLQAQRTDGLSEDCDEDNDWTCAACGEGYSADAESYSYDGESYCDGCYTDRFADCFDCGETYIREDMTRVWINSRRRYFCEDCQATREAEAEAQAAAEAEDATADDDDSSDDSAPSTAPDAVTQIDATAPTVRVFESSNGPWPNYSDGNIAYRILIHSDDGAFYVRADDHMRLDLTDWTLRDCLANVDSGSWREVPLPSPATPFSDMPF